MNRLIIVGSPRVNGRSAHLAETLFETCIEEYPNDEVALAPVSTLDIAPCTGCDACKVLVVPQDDAMAAQTDDDASATNSILQRCVIEDDMGELDELIEAADELVVVSPVYFAGPPAQLKALLDRLQPYFWTDERTKAKRPATLHIVGEGGDPHGFEPLVGIVRSALSCAGFSLDRVVDWVGKIDEDGDILAEANEYAPVPLGVAPDTVGSMLQESNHTTVEVVEESVTPPVSPSDFSAHRGGTTKPVLRVGQKAAPQAGQDAESGRNTQSAPKKQGSGKSQTSRKKGGQGAPGGNRGGQNSRDNQGSGRVNQGNGRPGQSGKRRG